MKILFILLVIIFVCNPQPLHAEPMFIEFAEMMQQAHTIVLGDYLGFVNPAATIHEPFGLHNLSVRQVLKGKADLGIMPVSRAHGEIQYELKPNTPCIAFLNSSGAFEWVATPGEGKNIEKDILFLRGFYDYNAYIVSVGGISLAQVKEYIEKGSFSFAAAGNLHFYDPKTQTMKPSEIYFELSGGYPYSKQSVQTKGLNLGSDFKKLTPNFSLPGYWNDGGIFSLVYESNMVRPLKFCAEVKDFDTEKQRFNAMFWVTNPEEIDEARFNEYLQNQQYGHPYYEIEIQTQKGKTYTFVYHEESGRIGKLNGYDQSLWECSSLGDPSVEQVCDMVFGYGREEQVIVRMDKLQKNVGYYDYPYRQDRLVRVLRAMGSMNGQLVFKNKAQQEQILDSCTIKLRASKWARNVNYRK